MFEGLGQHLPHLPLSQPRWRSGEICISCFLHCLTSALISSSANLYFHFLRQILHHFNKNQNTRFLIVEIIYDIRSYNIWYLPGSYIWYLGIIQRVVLVAYLHAGDLPRQWLSDICGRGRIEPQLQGVWDERSEPNVDMISYLLQRWFRSQMGPAPEQALWGRWLWELVQSFWRRRVIFLVVCMWGVDMSSSISVARIQHLLFSGGTCSLH